MPYDLFWSGHAWLTVSYKKAYRIRREQVNFDAYIQATYIYDVMSRLAPAYNAFAGGKTTQWLDKPYDLYRRDHDENIPPEENGKGSKGGIAFMQSFMELHNRKMEREAAMEDKDPNPSDNVIKDGEEKCLQAT